MCLYYQHILLKRELLPHVLLDYVLSLNTSLTTLSKYTFKHESDFYGMITPIIWIW